MIGRPRASTLFPYTTLFRSLRREGAQGLLGDLDRLGPVGIEQRDRKSTRLKSSHVATSYAVFCLRKTQLREPPHGAARDLGRVEARVQGMDAQHHQYLVRAR